MTQIIAYNSLRSASWHFRYVSWHYMERQHGHTHVICSETRLQWSCVKQHRWAHLVWVNFCFFCIFRKHLFLILCVRLCACVCGHVCVCVRTWVCVYSHSKVTMHPISPCVTQLLTSRERPGELHCNRLPLYQESHWKMLWETAWKHRIPRVFIKESWLARGGNTVAKIPEFSER